jgi:hypothetical protein
MKAPELTQNQMLNFLLRRNEAGKTIRRQRWEYLWDDVMAYLWPQMGSMKANTAFMPGEKRGQRSYDGTPEDALDVMVAGLQAGTIPENYPWFSWELVPKWLNKSKAVQVWLSQCRDICLEFLHASNFAMGTALTYKHLGAFGTACKWRAKDDEPGKAFGFNTLRLTDCVFFENKRGIVDTLFWEFKLSARNAVARWGKDAPGSCKRATESGSHDSEFAFLHCIFPREDYNAEFKDNKNMPFASWIIHPAKRKLVEESGFKIFPASVPRWDKLDDQAFAFGAQLQGGVYGRGPGIKVLQDMGILSAQGKANLIAAEQIVKPAMDIPSDGYERSYSTAPDARNWYDPSATHGLRAQTSLALPKELPVALQMQDRQRNIIKEAFHVDVFLTLAATPPGMTATEAMIRNQEKLLILEPMLSRQKVEHLQADLDWAFAVLNDLGYLPPAPDIVYMGGATGIRNIFKSPLFMAQESLKSDRIMKAYQRAAAVLQARAGKSDIMDMLNDDEALRIMLEADGVPPEIINDPDQVDKIRKARLQQRKEMIAEEQALKLSKAAMQFGKVKTGEGEENLAGDMVKQMTGEEG